MTIDERYSNNIIFNKIGLQQLLNNIKDYPIVNAEYLESGDSLTNNAPCIKITYGNEKSELGYLSYALTYTPMDGGYSWSDYNDKLKNKKTKEQLLKSHQVVLDRANRLYNELLSLYNQKIEEINAYLELETTINENNYEKVISELAEILTKYYTPTNEENAAISSLLEALENKNIKFPSQNIIFEKQNNIYDVTNFDNVPVYYLFENLRLYLAEITNENDIIRTNDKIRIFKDYSSIGINLNNVQNNYADLLQQYVRTENSGAILPTVEEDISASPQLKELLALIKDDENQFSSLTAIVAYITNNFEPNDSKISTLSDTEKRYISIIAALGLFHLIVVKYYQDWMASSADSGSFSNKLESLRNFIINQLGNAIFYEQQDSNATYNSDLEYYIYNNNEYILASPQPTEEEFRNNSNIYYIADIKESGELAQKIQQALNLKNNATGQITELNTEISNIETAIQGYFNWAKNTLNTLSDEDKEKLIGHAYLPVGNNIKFIGPEGDIVTQLNPPEAPQQTGTFRVSVNGTLYEVPIAGLAGGEGDIILSGNIIPKEDARYDIGTLTFFKLAKDFNEHEIYYVKNNNNYYQANPQPDNETFEDNSYYILETRRWKDLYLSNSINIGGNGDGIKNTSNNGRDLFTYAKLNNDFTAQEEINYYILNENEYILTPLVPGATYDGGIYYIQSPITVVEGNNVDASINTSGGIYAAQNIYGQRVFNAVFNDYAECRTTIDLEPGRVVIDQDDGALTCATARLQPGAQVISDTYGHLMGAMEGVTTPIAVAGRVLVYPFGNRNRFHAGMAVCSAPGGTVDIMTREEIREYPDCIVGIVSEIPNYEIWGSGNVKVNGRIWIKVK